MFLFKIYSSKGELSGESSGWVGGGNTNGCPSGNKQFLNYTFTAYISFSSNVKY